MDSTPERTGRFRVALLCGGPSLERGISLNSARSVMDHLDGDDVEVVPVYFDLHRNAYELSRGQLYSNTPSDFDFKLASAARPLREAELERRLRDVDLVFPLVHGPFGEDGELQSILEAWSLAFVGSGSSTCRACFDKHESGTALAAAGLDTLPTLLLTAGMADLRRPLQEFVERGGFERLVVKPACLGSSIGVGDAAGIDEAVMRARSIFEDGLDTRAVVQPYCHGREFTVIVLEDPRGEPVALVPTEVDVSDGAGRAIFNYRAKYLPTNLVTYHTPPRAGAGLIERIRMGAERVFELFGMHDVARIDGWIVDGPADGDARIVFSDLNPIPGMEQNSFVFFQSAQLGLTHRETLRHVVASACRRHHVPFREARVDPGAGGRERVYVLFGGSTAERQVSVMSGTNVWLKLTKSKRYEPQPFLLDANDTVWRLPYGKALYHTVEEIADACRRAPENETRIDPIRRVALARLRPPGGGAPDLADHLPEAMSLEAFLGETPLLFIALHGGFGENGNLQALAEARGVPYTGSGPEPSRTCMDKYRTGRRLHGMTAQGIHVANRLVRSLDELARLDLPGLDAWWSTLAAALETDAIVVKPPEDGCSAGVAVLHSASDLERYVRLAVEGADRIPASTFEAQSTIVEMPSTRPDRLLFEAYVETDAIAVCGHELVWRRVNDWVEITVTVLGARGRMRALNPSIAVAAAKVLTVEEKFQAGTGVNITPPPAEQVAPSVVAAVRERCENVANTLELSGFSRIDAFMHRKTGEILVIEVNTIPALTPSTVLYHQALAEDPSLYPLDVLDGIVAHAARARTTATGTPA